MKKLFFVMLVVSAAMFSCGPSSGTSSNDMDVTNSPTGDTAITDGGTGASIGAQGSTDTTGTPMPSDTTGTGTPMDSTARP